MRVSDSMLALGAGAPPGLLPAREQMALSLGFHIVLACFGVVMTLNESAQSCSVELLTGDGCLL